MGEAMATYKHSELTDAIINAFYHVYNTLGYGFLEKVYENALVMELRQRGYRAEQQVPIKVFYEGAPVGDYYADLVVNGLIILELKAAETLAPEHEAQLLNYLRATDMEVGLLLNFGPKPQVRRKIYETVRRPVAVVSSA
jgi:GxxExxY protein